MTDFQRTSPQVFENPGLALLAAGGFTTMAASGLAAHEREPFERLHAALRRWYADQTPSALVEIYKELFPQCANICFQYNDRRHPSDAALSCAYLQFRAILPIVGRALPGDGFYDMGFDHFVDLGKRSAKIRGISVSLLGRRLARLFEGARDPWEQQCLRCDRMGWERRISERAMSKRLRPMIVELASGADWEWTEIAGTPLLRIAAASGSSSIRLDDDELAELSQCWPELGAGPSK